MSKKRCEHYATKINACFLDSKESSEAVNEFNRYLLKDPELEKYSCQANMLRSLASKGIGIHHAGLNPLLKEIVEKLFSSGFLRILFATGTFTVGLNMPIRTVALTGLTVCSDNVVRNFNSDEFIQMCGRAGRRGLDTKGYVVINLLNEDPPELHEMRSMMTNNADSVSSRLELDCNLVIDLISNGKNKDEIMTFLKNTLYYKEINTTINNLENEKENHEFLNYEGNFNKEGFDEYLKIKEKLSTPLRQNQLKKSKFLLEETIKKYDLVETIKEYEKFIQCKNKYNDICNKITVLKICDSEKLTKILDFLKSENYIDDTLSLTTKGLIASCVNGYNKIVVSEILVSDWINSLSVIELGILLSFFIEYTSNDKESEYHLHEHDDVSLWFVSNVKEIKSFDSFEINFSFCSSIYQWMKKENVISVTSYNEGNFITQVNLMCQFIDNLLKICETNNMHVLFKKLEELKDLIRRDIIISQSLYL